MNVHLICQGNVCEQPPANVSLPETGKCVDKRVLTLICVFYPAHATLGFLRNEIKSSGEKVPVEGLLLVHRCWGFST